MFNLNRIMKIILNLQRKMTYSGNEHMRSIFFTHLNHFNVAIFSNWQTVNMKDVFLNQLCIYCLALTRIEMTKVIQKVPKPNLISNIF